MKVLILVIVAVFGFAALPASAAELKVGFHLEGD
jgi:hypothetical protein